MKYHANKKGFSLIEIVAVTAFIGVLTVIVSSLMSQSLKTYRVGKERVDLQDRGAVVTRNFEQMARAATEIVTASSNELIFYRFFDLTSSSPKQVRYFLTGDTLDTFEIGITDPIGTEPNISYPPEREDIDLIIDNVTSLSFEYFNDFDTQLVLPFEPKLVRMLNLTISLDKDVNKSPQATVLSTTVSLRNLKTNL